MSQYHLAQVNIAVLRAPIDDPMIADFVARLDEVNAIAESSTGFVWRLAGEENNATALRVFDNQNIIINMSVWDSLETLFDFAYKQHEHVEVFRRRKDWFVPMETAHLALWWIPAGHIPSPQEGKAKLEYIDQHGVTAHAFTFKQRFTVEEWLTASDMVGK